MSRSVRAIHPSALPELTEHQEQSLLLQWCTAQYVSYPELRWLFAVPNQTGGDKSAIIRGQRMKREGLKPGYPDLGLDHARGPYHGLRIELKRRHSNQPSPMQLLWGQQLEREGYRWQVCRGWEAARDALIAYLRLPRCPTK